MHIIKIKKKSLHLKIVELYIKSRDQLAKVKWLNARLLTVKKFLAFLKQKHAFILLQTFLKDDFFLFKKQNNIVLVKEMLQRTGISDH